MRSLIMEMRTKQLDEANSVLDTMLQSRALQVYRLKYYLKLLGVDSSAIPDERKDFTKMNEGIDAPATGVAYNMITEEKQQQDQLVVTKNFATDIRATKAYIATLHANPSISISMEPQGIGASVSAGAKQLGAMFSSNVIVTQIVQAISEIDAQGFSMAASGKQRLAQERLHQVNVAGYEIKNIDKQVISQRIRMEMAAQEIKNQQKSIKHATELDDFLHSKFTSKELYSQMEGSIRKLHYQTYTLAYDMALKAQKTFRFERPNDKTDFITPRYWNSGRDGLMAGQNLLLDLQKLQAASQERRGYDFEVIKHISLRQWCPIALFSLRETGLCEFEFLEILFDMDFPGQYLRRISSISVTIPCVLSPYMSINCTVRLLSHKYRLSTQADQMQVITPKRSNRTATSALALHSFPDLHSHFHLASMTLDNSISRPHQRCITPSMALESLERYLPMFAHRAKNVVATDVYLLSTDIFKASMVVRTTTVTLTTGSPINKLNVLQANNLQVPIGDCVLNLQEVVSNLDFCWLLIRYVMTQFNCLMRKSFWETTRSSQCPRTCSLFFACLLVILCKKGSDEQQTNTGYSHAGYSQISMGKS